jgi:hypothetical protein
MQKVLFISSLAFLLCSCNVSDSKFEYIKLKDFKYTKGEIRPISEIELLSVSGGKPCTNEEIYFYQFIGIDKTTNDTVRILSPCQEYDVLSKAIRIGYFQPIADASQKGINYLIDPSSKDEDILEDHFFVVVNKSHFTELRNYKTMIGSVSFKQ